MKSERVFYTYLWLREDGTPYYVGKGFGYRAFTSDAHTYGCPLNPENILVEECPDEARALEDEKLLIAIYGRKDNGTGILRNLTDGGEGIAGYVFSEEQIQRLSESHMGHVPSKETRQKMSESRRGVVFSKETRQKISNSSKGHQRCLGRVLSDETRRKISESHKGLIFTAEHRRKMSESAKGKKKPPRSIEHQDRLNAAHRGKHLSAEHKVKLSIAALKRNAVT
jgi:NUMOD3 motif